MVNDTTDMITTGALRADTPASLAPAATTARRPRLMVLGTGGTIAGNAANPANGAVYEASVLGIDSLLAAIPQLGTLAEIAYEQFDNIDSKNATPAFWSRLAYRLERLDGDDAIDGIVVTHGTDTLEETAFFLDLALTARKPVVLTAAMRPANAVSADGPLNLMDALSVAAHCNAAGRGVLVVLAGQIHAARHVSKVHTNSVAAFSSGEAGLLGFIHGGTPAFYGPATRASGHGMRAVQAIDGVGQTGMADKDAIVQAPQPVQVPVVAGKHDVPGQPSRWCGPALPSVEIIFCHAGASRLFIDCAVAAGARGIVLAALGNGSLNDEMEAAAAEAVGKGVIVVRSTRVAHGGVLHKASAADDPHGLVSAAMLSPARARILLMLALQANVTSTAALQDLFASV